MARGFWLKLSVEVLVPNNGSIDGQRHFEQLDLSQLCWSTAFRRPCMSNAGKAAKACTPAQSGAVQLDGQEWQPYEGWNVR